MSITLKQIIAISEVLTSRLQDIEKAKNDNPKIQEKINNEGDYWNREILKKQLVHPPLSAEIHRLRITLNKAILKKL
jgi:hypothetical protein